MLLKAVKCILVILLFQESFCRKLTMKKVICKTFDEDFVKFDLCQIAPIAKNVPALSIIIRLLKPPITNMRLGVALGMAGSTPLMPYNGSWDACAFLANRKSNRALARLHRYIEPFTNMNHPCPYDHDLYVKNLTIGSGPSVFVLLNGNYLVQVNAIVDGRNVFSVEIMSTYKF